MAISDELTRIQTAKADIKASIEAKGVQVPSNALIDTYDTYIGQISGGGGGTQLLKSIDVSDFTGTSYNLIANYITEATIPSGVTSIGMSALSDSSITSITIPSSVTSIGMYAFNGCTGLTSITIPSSVTSIGGSAFYNCTNLTTITIPSSVTSIGGSVLNGCTSLTSITILATTPPTLSNVNAFYNTNNCPIYVPAESVAAYQAANNWSTYASRIQAIPSE